MAKYKRTNLGFKSKVETVTKSKEPSISYPTFYVRNKLPITAKDVGKTFDVQAKIKCVGLDQRIGEDKNNLDYTFEIREIQF